MKPIGKYIAGALVAVNALFGIVMGGFLFYVLIISFRNITGSGYILLALNILLLVLVFVLTSYIIYTYHLMLRGKSYMPIKSISILIAIFFFYWISPVSHSLAIKASAKGMNFIALILRLANLPLTLLLYCVCVRVLKKLCVIRSGPMPDETMPNSD
jgi:hypothetical protein